jgi:hypothetical protein
MASLAGPADGSKERNKGELKNSLLLFPISLSSFVANE